MTTLAWAFAAVAVVAAAVDWWCVGTQGPSTVRYVSKPLALVGLIGVAATVDPGVSSAVRAWMVVGLVLSLGGDVFLLSDQARWFIAGLVSFLLGHLAYVVAMVQAFDSAALLALGVVVVLVAVATVGRRVVSGVAAGDDAEMRVPVIAYLAVISTMVVCSFGTAAPWAMLGALLFYASDATLAWNRFLEPRRWGPLAVMVTYHLGQAGLVAWVVTG